uniref:Mediator of DNA damage checkpoint protein 1 n=2 Tax=Monopterus albus TaxID=43700 RepID=A0A3Q3RE04_MONAL
MDATQLISDSILESDEEENVKENENNRGRPLAKLCILENEHISETELPLFFGDNVLGRDPNSCALPLPAPSVSKQHATISISVYRRRGCHSEVDIEALVWDLGSMNGTRKGHLKLTPNVRYALSDGDHLVLADIPCQYVSCAVNTASSQRDMRTPVTRNTKIKARLPDDLSEKMTLVPDTDSDEEREGGEHKATDYFSSTNVIIPESPIIPLSSTKNTRALVDDSEEQEEMEDLKLPPGGIKSDKIGQYLPVKQESNLTLTREDEMHVSTPAPAVSTDVIHALNMDSDTDVEEEKMVASVCPLTMNTNQVSQPGNTDQFHMDSDTDIDENEGALDKASKTVPSTDDSTRSPHIMSVIQHEGITMDSDTEVADNAAVSHAAANAKPALFQSSHTTDFALSTQPKDFCLDSDTDVDEEKEREHGPNKSSSKTDSSPTKLDMSPGPKSAPAAHQSLHFDNDTNNEAVPALSEPSVVSATTETFTTVVAETDLDILSNSDTDVEDNCPLVMPVDVTTLSLSPGTTSAAPHSVFGADTDVDKSSMPPAGDKDSLADLKVDSDTDVENKEADIPATGCDQIHILCREETSGVLLPLFPSNCSTPVQMSGISSQRGLEDMKTQAFPVKSSAVRPIALSSCSDSEEDEDFAVAETQSFIFQTRDSHGSPPPDHTMEPTQAFVLEHSGDEKDEQCKRTGSFQLAPSNSSYLQSQAQALATESTQVFVSDNKGMNLEDTQAYAAISTADRASEENATNINATQIYGECEKPVRCSEMSEKEGQEDMSLDATQAYILESCSESAGTTDEDERKNTNVETQPLDLPTSSTLGITETQPTSAFEEESLAADKFVSSVLQVKHRTQNEMEEREKSREAAQPQQKTFSEALSLVEIQPMHTCDDEDSISGPRKTKAKSLQLEEEKTQSFTNSVLLVEKIQPMQFGLAETQPMATSGNEESDVEDLVPGLEKRKGKQLRCKEEKTHALTNSDVSAVETHPMDVGGVGDSDEEDSFPVCQRKRKAKPLQLEEAVQPLTSSALSTVETQPMQFGLAETQPMATSGNEESDVEDLVPGLEQRKGKGLQSEEEKTQALTNSDLSIIETQPVVASGVEDGDKEDSFPVSRRKRKAKPLQLEEETQPSSNSEVFASETQPMGACEDDQSDEGALISGARKRKAKLLHLEKEEMQPLTNSAVSTVEAQSLETKAAERPKRGRGRQSEAGTSGLSLRNKSGTRGRLSRLGDVKDVANLRQQRDKMEKKNREINEREKEQEEMERQQRREEQEIVEREIKEKEEQERLQAEHAERTKPEQARVEKERKKQNERLDQKEKEEQFKRVRKETEEKERLEHEKAEREEKEKLREEKERKEQEERLETEKRELEELQRERKEQERQAKQREVTEREKREQLEKEKDDKEKQIKELQENKVPTRGQRATRRTIATEAQQDSAILTSDDVPARRTRSRSSSVSSERSASSITTLESRGRGRGRGVRTSELPQAATTRSRNRRSTVAMPTEQNSNDISPQGVLSRSTSSSSLNSEISNCSVSSQSKGRRRKTEPKPDSSVNSHRDQTSAPKPAARGQKSRNTSNEVSHRDDKDKADSQQASSTRGRGRAGTDGSEPTATEEEQLNQKKVHTNEESHLAKGKVGRRGQKAAKSETAETTGASAVSDNDETKDKRKGRRRELPQNTEADLSCSSKGKVKILTTKAAEEEGKEETRDENPIQANRRGRASSAQTKKNAQNSPPEVEVKDKSEKMEVETVEKRTRGRPSAAQQKKKDEQEDSGTSVRSINRNAEVSTSEPRTPAKGVSQKRQAPADSSPVAKTRRCSSASPAASCQLRTASQAYKVLFTGVADETLERVLARLGGSMAKGVTDMNCLVTDKVRRTVKLLCAVAKGVPIVTTDWLEKSGKAGSFLSPNAFVVKDSEQEKKFSFCLQESLGTASSQPLLQGYKIHVTKSVKPEPVHMKEIISCSGATFLPKMPSSHKPHTVVISCEEDWPLCRPAVSASLPVVTAEFILTGILQQKLDFQTHSLAPNGN